MSDETRHGTPAPEHVSRNRDHWNAQSDEYQDRHGPQLAASGGMAWGVWQIPESELRVLGSVAGKDVLELGCGAGQWSRALADAGARPVGLDLSERQLHHTQGRRGVGTSRIPFVQASAESVPLRNASFDIVLSDYGATTFSDPLRTIPEAARVLRPGGFLVFTHSNPILDVCWPAGTPHPGQQLSRDYFELRELEDDGATQFQLPFGEWIRLFGASGLVVEQLIELRPSAEATSSYRTDEDRAWARRWPAECLWKVRRR